MNEGVILAIVILPAIVLAPRFNALDKRPDLMKERFDETLRRVEQVVDAG